MSRVGRAAIEVPPGTKVAVNDGVVLIEGPQGKLAQPAHPGISVSVDGATVTCTRDGDSGPQRARHGLVRALIANAVEGVSRGFQKDLEIVGVGYRAEVKDQEAHFALGFSHPVVFRIPDGIQVQIERQTRITVRGIDKQQVGQVAAQLRGLRPPDAYKGKGVRYVGETIRLKVGKSGAGTR